MADGQTYAGAFLPAAGAIVVFERADDFVGRVGEVAGGRRHGRGLDYGGGEETGGGNIRGGRVGRGLGCGLGRAKSSASVGWISVAG